MKRKREWKKERKRESEVKDKESYYGGERVLENKEMFDSEVIMICQECIDPL